MNKKATLRSLKSVPLSEIVRDEYRTYQIYTLMDRAIPYLQDGLKPGQRRILFTLYKNQSKGFIKVTAATGLVLTLHPHGPASIESTIVNLAQDYTFSNNYPLIDKKGYFGERMETSPAAGRYIECKLDKIAEYLLFDDMDQVEMVPNYDETAMEPVALLPKLPIMLLNGAEGIGTGFSSIIPSFHHKDICRSLICYLETGKTKKLRPYVRHYQGAIEKDKGRYIFPIKIENKDGSIMITELPRGYDAQKIYKYLNKHIDQDYIKDFIDSSVGNNISIELVFKRGKKPELDEVEKKIKVSASLTPNYTLISERGVKNLSRPEEILEIFANQRLEVVKKRYFLRANSLKDAIKKNNEIIRFIKAKEYVAATKQKNRQSFIKYLENKKYIYHDYLADMPIYRMTQEEVKNKEKMVKDDKKKLSEYLKISASPKLVKAKLIEELYEVESKLSDWMHKGDQNKKKS